MPKNPIKLQRRKNPVVPLSMPPVMLAEVKRVSGRAGLSDADIMRLSIERGLPSVAIMFAKPETTATK